MSESLTTDELRQLPLRAIVALCARCAARLRPDFDLPGGSPDRGRLMAAVDSSVRIARSFAGGSPLPNDAREVVAAAMDAAGEAPADMFGVSATKAGMAAGVAVTAHDAQVQLIPGRAHMCVRAVGREATAARSDYERLRNLGLGTFPDLGLPVDASEDGPLGPLWGPDDRP